ncbi:MAG: hypothetical protein U0M21_00640 [Emergencia sp.]|nr:hypothetical protein [Emergencia sp.]
MKAMKANKVYEIAADQSRFYIDAGFDIVDDTGNIVAYGRGKTVPYGKYAEVVKEITKLKSENAGTEDTEALKKECEHLAKENARMQTDVLPILKMYCAEHEIDIGKTSTVSGILAKIKENQKEV